MIETIAFIECKCGATFQEVKTIIIDEESQEEQIVFDEEKTAELYYQHKCN